MQMKKKKSNKEVWFLKELRVQFQDGDRNYCIYIEKKFLKYSKVHAIKTTHGEIDCGIPIHATLSASNKREVLDYWLLRLKMKKKGTTQ